MLVEEVWEVEEGQLDEGKDIIILALWRINKTIILKN